MTKDELQRSVLHEIEVCKHIYEQLNETAYDLKLSPSGRSTIELMRYLSFCVYEFGKALVENAFENSNWDSYKEAEKLSSEMEAAEFCEVMDQQAQKFKTLLADISDSDFKNKEVTPPWGKNNTLGALLVDISLKFLVAYRMQLFLHAKAAGISELNTGDCWAGSHYEDS